MEHILVMFLLIFRFDFSYLITLIKSTNNYYNDLITLSLKKLLWYSVRETTILNDK